MALSGNGLTLGRLKILNRCCTPQVKEVLARSDIPRARPFSRGDMSEGVFDVRSFTECLATRSCLLQLAKALLLRLVLSDLNASSVP